MYSHLIFFKRWYYLYVLFKCKLLKEYIKITHSYSKNYSYKKRLLFSQNVEFNTHRWIKNKKIVFLSNNCGTIFSLSIIKEQIFNIYESKTFNYVTLDDLFFYSGTGSSNISVWKYYWECNNNCKTIVLYFYKLMHTICDSWRKNRSTKIHPFILVS